MRENRKKRSERMGKGRAPCCDKSKVKRGPWSPAEDLRLITFIQKHGHENWRALPKQAGLMRCGKSCRLRWINYLRPDVKRGNFTKEEEETIIKLHASLGNKWSKIASYLPGRTDNEIKNVWNTHLKKKLPSNGDESKESSVTSSSSSSSLEIPLEESQHSPMEITKTTKDPKEVLSSDSSISSNNSNLTNSSTSSQVEVSKPDQDQDQMGSLIFDYIGPYDVHETLQEVNKPDQALFNLGFDVLLENDFDFWSMLDGFDDNQPVQFMPEVEATQRSDTTNREAEDNNNSKWFCYLEKELGLETTRDIGNGTIGLEPYEILLKPEDDSGTGFFPLWPSSPNNVSGI